MASRFQRRAAPDERVGEILSDSNSEVSSVEGDHRGGAAQARTRNERKPTKRGANVDVVSASDHDEKEDDDDDGGQQRESDDAMKALPVPAKVHQRPPPLQAMKRKNSKWYDSDDDDDWEHMASDGDRAASKATDRARSRSVPAAKHEELQQQRQLSSGNSIAETVTSPEANQPRAVLSPDASAAPTTKPPPEKRSSFQRLVGKTFNLSPFGSKRKGLDNVTSPASSGPDTPRAGAGSAAGGGGPGERMTSSTKRPNDAVARVRSPLSDVSSVGDAGPVFSNASERRLGLGALGRKKSHDPSSAPSDQTNGSDVVSPQGYRHSPAAADAAAASRRRSTMVQSPGADDVSSAMRRGSELPTAGVSAAGEALSPGQRKVPGAFPGRPDSGVLLEGWLRQKQRRGVKGMKKWNSRYFVLYAKTNEVRYYADVVQSAWGPIPLGEIGCISLRLIQRIGKPGTLKYKGCRLDITCRNTWGTHYADDYVSSDEENSNNNAHDGTGGGGNDHAARATRSADKNTPKSSRVYSLMADSPQTAGAWFSMLDSLLVRSANSPRVDVAPSAASGKQLKRLGSAAAMQGATAAGTPSSASTKMMTRRRMGTLDTETIVVCGPNDHVPKAVLYAINFIFDSSPGIETEKFYEVDADAGRVKSALKFLNQFALDSTRKPSKDELEQVLDAVTAGAVVKLWLTQLEQPLVPFEMYDDFRALAADAKAAPFELARNLQSLVRALPPRNFAMLACVLFHLNDVNVYASKNGMDAATLAALFSDFIVRPRAASANNQEDVQNERALLRVVVEEMIAHVDAIIDEKEAEILDRV